LFVKYNGAFKNNKNLEGFLYNISLKNVLNGNTIYLRTNKLNKYIEWGIAFLIFRLILNHFLEPMSVKSVVIILLHALLWPIFLPKFIWDYVISPKINKNK